jgi:hypothetical protein
VSAAWGRQPGSGWPVEAGRRRSLPASGEEERRSVRVRVRRNGPPAAVAEARSWSRPAQRAQGSSGSMCAHPRSPLTSGPRRERRGRETVERRLSRVAPGWGQAGSEHARRPRVVATGSKRRRAAAWQPGSPRAVHREHRDRSSRSPREPSLRRRFQGGAGDAAARRRPRGLPSPPRARPGERCWSTRPSAQPRHRDARRARCDVRRRRHDAGAGDSQEGRERRGCRTKASAWRHARGLDRSPPVQRPSGHDEPSARWRKPRAAAPNPPSPPFAERLRWWRRPLVPRPPSWS